MLTVHTETMLFQDGLTNQRQRLSNELGLTVGNVKLSTTEDLFDDSDLVQSEQNNHNNNALAETKQVRASGVKFIFC